jgi:hypothetical protein
VIAQQAIERGEERRVEAPARVRLEVVAPTPAVDAVIAALRPPGGGPLDAVVQPVTPVTASAS